MEWVDTTEEHHDGQEGRHEPFEVLRDTPNQLTFRVKAISAAEEELDLKAFPPLFDGETEEQRIKRLKAYASSWKSMEDHIKEVLEATNTSAFQALAAYAFQQHSSPHKWRAAASRQRIIPTALAVAGSISAADHSETFPALVAELRRKGCYVALVGPRELAASGSVAPALLATLRHFSGLSTDADDMQALLAWYKDELESRPAQQQPSPEKTASAILSPLGKLGLKTPSKAPRTAQQQEESPQGTQLEAGQIASPFGKLALQTPKTRKLRPRSVTPCKSQTAPKAREADQAAGLDASARPLVVVVEEAESVDSMVLQDLILVISENHAELPITLLLGMATSASALAQMLPTGASDLLAPRNFQLVQALAKLEVVFREVLLSKRNRLFFEHSLLRALDDHFMRQDFTVRSVQSGLQLAFLRHFQQRPLSFLAAVPGEDLAQACARLPKPLLKEATKLMRLSGRVTGSTVANTLAATAFADARWRLAVLCVNATAVATGHRAVSDGFSVRELYRDASTPGFSASTRGRDLLHSLERGLQSLQVEASVQLLQQLLSLTEDRVWADDETTKQQLDKMKALIQEQGSGAATRSRGQAEDLDVNNGNAAAATAAATDAAEPTTSAAAASVTEMPQGLPRMGAGSAAARRLALVKAVQASKAPRQGSAMQGSEQAKLAADIWGVLQMSIAALDCPPSATPGASACCVRGERSPDRAALSFAPRVAINRALSQPESYMGGDALGLCPSQHDTAIAYQLLIEYGEEVDVADWFTGFCAVYQVGGLTQQPAEPVESPPKKAKRGRPRGSKKVFQTANAGAKPASATDGRSVHKAVQQSREAEEPASALPADREACQDGAAAAEFQVPVQELASRFTQATNELQLMGIVKAATSKRRGSFAQRLVWGTGRVAGSSSAAV